MDEHVLSNDSDLQLSSSTLQGDFDYIAHLAENTLYQQHMVKAEDYGGYYVPQWIGYQQTAPYYFEYLAGNGIPYDSNGTGCSFTPQESVISMDANQVIHSRQQHEQVPVDNFKHTHHELCYQKKDPKEGLDNAAQHQPNMSVSTSSIPTKSRKTRLKKNYYETDRRRRRRIAAGLDALDELLPQSTEGNKANVVDDCLDYIKYLQLQLKELSQNRLGGEPTSNQLMYLEGYGHYLVHENTASEPLQDVFAKLLESNPSEVTTLLESRDLFMMPFLPN